MLVEDWNWFLVGFAFVFLIAILTLDIITLVHVLDDSTVTVSTTEEREAPNDDMFFEREDERENTVDSSKIWNTVKDLKSILAASPSVDTVDVVISLGPKDLDIIPMTVQSLQEHCDGLHKIYIVSSQNSQIELPGVVWIEETKFPFSKQGLNTAIGIPEERCGWYLQQLIKLYAPTVIPDLQDHYLVWDADTILLRKTAFVCRNRALFSYSNQYHVPYFDHMKRLAPFLTKSSPYSGVCNFMVLNRWSLKRLFFLVEHTNGEKPFWMCFMDAVSKDQYTLSGASEFEIYFHYMHKFEPEKFTLRPLECLDGCPDVTQLTKDQRAKYDIVSSHWYLRSKAAELGKRF